MPDSFKHNVDVLGAGQATFEQCWFASYKMIFKFAKRNTNEVEDRLRKAGNYFDDAMKLGLLDNDYKKSAEALGLKAWTGSPFNLKPVWYDAFLSDGAHAFLKELAIGPMWVSRKSGSSNHAVVAVGYDDDRSVILWNNPFPGPNNAEEKRLDANLFVRNITGAMGSVQAFR